jgi:hypothetical protein
MASNQNSSPAGTTGLPAADSTGVTSKKKIT